MCLSTVATFVRSQGGDLTRLVELISYADINPQQQEFLDNLARQEKNHNKSLSPESQPARVEGGSTHFVQECTSLGERHSSLPHGRAET